MKKTIGLIILLMMTLITLTGCAQLNYEVEVKSNGSGEISYIYGISKEILEDINISAEEFVSEMKGQAEESNYQVEAYEDDTIAGFKASKHVDDLNTEFSLQEAFSEYVKDTEENGIKVEKGFFNTKYSQTAELDLTTISENEQNYITMTYQVKLPVKAKSNNADETFDNGKTLKWNLTAGEINKIEFTANKTNTLPIILIVIVIIAIAIVVIMISKKKSGTKNEN